MKSPAQWSKRMFTLMRDIGIETLTSNGAARPTGNKNHLFVIAIDRYDLANFPQFPVGDQQEYRFKPLMNAVTDANNVVQVLLSRYKFGTSSPGKKRTDYEEEIIEYDSIEVKCLYNENATSANISAHLSQLSDILTENDNLLIYYAGHGVNLPDGTTGYLVPFDGIKKKNYENSFVRFSKLYETFFDFEKRKKCMDLLLILDCCFAGTSRSGYQLAKTEFFSRYALVSSSMHEKAADGLAGQGSPFARALCNLLLTNTYPLASLDKKAFSDQFSRFYVEMYEEEPAQQLDYFTLPTDYGQGEFIFELREPDVPPVDQLSVSFIRHLNFLRQRNDLAMDFNRGGRDDFIIITTMCPNFNIHKLQGKVFFEEMRTQQNIDLKFSLHIVLEPDKTSSGAWEALAATKGVNTNDSNYKQQCALILCGQILRDETIQYPDKPLIIYVGCNFQSTTQSESIMAFCKELHDEISTIKQTETFRNKKFDRIILVIAETRAAQTPFFTRDLFIGRMGKDVKIIISGPVEPLFVGHANKWLALSKKEIKSKNLQKIEMASYFPEGHDYEIESFIIDISKGMGVDKLKLEEQLWLF